jgi:outer membrane protein assembly factor BamB
LLATNVLMWHNDPAGTGLNSHEESLTPANVNSTSFGKLFSYPVQGQVYAQPLYISNLSIPGQGTRNVVFVATQNNDVYALDANSTSGPNGGVLWHVNLGTAAATPSPFIGFRYGPFRDVSPQVGITSTPVIDLSAGTMYLDAFTNDIVGQDAYSHHIHALDIRTGQHKVPPKLVTASVPGNGVGGNGTTVTFAANRHIQRAAMTMCSTPRMPRTPTPTHITAGYWATTRTRSTR